MPHENSTQVELPKLPVVEAMERLRSALAQGHAVLTAEPGSGKTTLTPLLLLDEPWLRQRKILMLEPRRPAARMAARRMAQLLGERVGQTVGYQIRFERRISAATRIEVLTEGLLLRRLQADPELPGVGLVIFDEFHERNLQGDLSLALSLDVVAELREDLRLLVMSASLDAGPLVDLMPAQAVNAGGRQYPVEVDHADRDGDVRDPVPACMRELAVALRETAADVLVFLPGRREIERMRDQVASEWADQVEALTLYGDMPADAQDAVLQGRVHDARRRVIMATDIAETSLTIEGVQAVVDSGLARRPVFDPNTGLTRLETTWISKASALQRAGRAGRLGPGRCYRAWTLARHDRLQDWTRPEIVEADLSALVLDVASWGLAAPDALQWLDRPPAAHWQQAVGLLRQLDALDHEGRITATGRRMSHFPAHPRLAHVLAQATRSAEQRLAADVAALLSERDPLRRAAVGERSADIGLRLDALAAWRAKAPLAAEFDRDALRRVDRVARQFLHLCPHPTDADDGAPSPARCLALAYPDRVAVRTSGGGQRYLMRNGRAALLSEGDPLQSSALLAIAEIDAGRVDGVIWLAAALERAEFETWFAAQIETRREVRWDDARSDIVGRSVRRLDALVLSDDPVPLQPGDAVDALLIEQIRRRGLAQFFDDPVQLRARVELARRLEPHAGWPDFSEQGLLDSIGDWLPPWLKPGQGARQLRAIALREVLTVVLGWERGRRLERWLPGRFATPAGTQRAIQYAFDGPPVLAVPLQELLGLRDGPLLADGQVAVVLHLLSPAGHPLQVTSDLAGFWAGAYDEVKKEMRGRYPKHYWPDDPVAAKATRFTKRRM